MTTNQTDSSALAGWQRAIDELDSTATSGEALATRDLLDATPPPQAATPLPEQDERAMFEAWYGENYTPYMPRMTDGPYAGEYSNTSTQAIWCAWQARAALAQQAAPVAPGAMPVVFMGLDPLNIVRNPSLPMIPDSWRYGFYTSGDELRFGAQDSGPLVAWDAIKDLIATETPTGPDGKGAIAILRRAMTLAGIQDVARGMLTIHFSNEWNKAIASTVAAHEVPASGTLAHERIPGMSPLSAATTASASGGEKCADCQGDGFHVAEVLTASGVQEFGGPCTTCNGTGRAPAPSREADAKASDARYRAGYSSGWDEGRAALAQQATPSAEVDAEGLPPLPKPCAIDPYHGEEFTADQYRQGQREAIEFDRARRAGSTTGDAGPVPVERIQGALDAVQNAMQDAYNNAYQQCCGHGIGGECCGNPDAAWSVEDQRIMDALAPAERELTALLFAAAPQSPPVGDAP